MFVKRPSATSSDRDVAGIAMMRHVTIVGIAIAGAFGALARYGLDGAVSHRSPGAFPWGTFVVNVTGCLLMGVVATLLTDRLVVHPNWRFLIPIGFIGAYTTFSTFEYETFRAVAEGAWMVGALNVLASVVAGYAALWIGVVLSQRM